MIDDWVRDVLMVLAIAWAVRQGFFRPPGAFLSWPMFTYVSYYRANVVRTVELTPVNLWRHRIHIDFGGDERELQDILTFLQERHSIVVSGDGIVADPTGYRRYEIVDSVVVS